MTALNYIKQRIAELEKLGNEASAGPWQEIDQGRIALSFHHNFSVDSNSIIRGGDPLTVVESTKERNAKFIAEARNNWAGMLDALKVLIKYADESDTHVGMEDGALAIEQAAKALGWKGE